MGVPEGGGLARRRRRKPPNVDDAAARRRNGTEEERNSEPVKLDSAGPIKPIALYKIVADVSGGLARTGRKPGYPAGCGSEPLGERPGGRLADAVDGFEFRS